MLAFLYLVFWCLWILLVLFDGLFETLNFSDNAFGTSLSRLLALQVRCSRPLVRLPVRGRLGHLFLGQLLLLLLVVAGLLVLLRLLRRVLCKVWPRLRLGWARALER